jgi:hypothetical protein
MLLLHDLHWLRYPEQNDYKLAVLVYRCLHGLAPSYLVCKFQYVSDLATRRQLQTASTADFVMPRVRQSTLGGRVFPVVAARIWNGLPSHVTLSTSLSSFKSKLKSELFAKSYYRAQ